MEFVLFHLLPTAFLIAILDSDRYNTCDAAPDPLQTSSLLHYCNSTCQLLTRQTQVNVQQVSYGSRGQLFLKAYHIKYPHH